jgi:hypothetical protein
MAKGHTARRLRGPAQFIDGAWECKFGGQIPVGPGTNAEIIVDRGSISDAEFLKTLEAKDFHKVLDEDAILLVGLTVRPENPLRNKLKQLLRSYGELWRELGTTTPDLDSDDTHFVEVRLAGPNKRQAKLLGTSRGGLWLMTEGIEATGLVSTTIKLPEKITNDPVASVNHAYTRLSEIFETSRISARCASEQGAAKSRTQNRSGPLDEIHGQNDKRSSKSLNEEPQRHSQTR